MSQTEDLHEVVNALREEMIKLKKGAYALSLLALTYDSLRQRDNAASTRHAHRLLSLASEALFAAQEHFNDISSRED